MVAGGKMFSDGELALTFGAPAVELLTSMQTLSMGWLEPMTLNTHSETYRSAWQDSSLRPPRFRR
jgi:hypothetical protein